MIAAAIRLPFSMMARNASISFSRSMTILPNCGKVHPCLHQLSREPANATSALALREEDVAWTSWTLRTYRRQRAPIFDPQGVARRATLAPRHMYLAAPVDAETPRGSPLCGPQRSGKAMAAFAALKRKIQIRCETGHIGAALFALVNRLGAGPEANGDDA